jgi:hypothetical protein
LALIVGLLFLQFSGNLGSHRLSLDTRRVSEVDESSEIKRAEIEFTLVMAISVEHEQTKVTAKVIERVVQVAIKPKLFCAQRMMVFDLDAGDFAQGPPFSPARRSPSMNQPSGMKLTSSR